MAEEAFNRKRSIFCGPLEKELRKRLMKSFVWSVTLHGAETWTLRRSEEKRIEAFEMWIWRRMEHVKGTDRIRNEAVLERVGEERMMLKVIRKRKGNWLGHWLRRNCLLKDALEGMGNGEEFVTFTKMFERSRHFHSTICARNKLRSQSMFYSTVKNLQFEMLANKQMLREPPAWLSRLRRLPAAGLKLRSGAGSIPAWADYLVGFFPRFFPTVSWLFNDAVSTTRLFSVDEIGDSEMVFGQMRPRIRRRLPDIHLTVGENLAKTQPDHSSGSEIPPQASMHFSPSGSEQPPIISDEQTSITMKGMQPVWHTAND
ncbi:hypothetical protein ANN_23041 [Periplaneta americana]|uniref:Uncharacterized protein n=1 Tax=Periplaneta americana TaxID=6978 RepID=A0ABQ8SKU2_PERAM|nr:hypothetical protein ANN_23041 [Periplaneta americana]